MPKSAKAEELRDEANSLRERASFYDMEARYGPPPPVEEAQRCAERLRRLAEELDAEAREVLSAAEPPLEP